MGCGNAGLGLARQGKSKEDQLSRKISVKLKGISPLLMHSFPLVPIEAIEKKSPAEQAEISAYRDPATKELYIPGVNIQRALVSAATYSKGKGRSNLVRLAAACLLVEPQKVFLGTNTYEVDSRAVVVPATKGRVVRHRPRLDQWEVSFDIEYDENLLDEKQIRQMVDNAGSRVGFLDFRPEKKGPFGRAMVTEWKSEERSI